MFGSEFAQQLLPAEPKAEDKADFGFKRQNSKPATLAAAAKRLVQEELTRKLSEGWIRGLAPHEGVEIELRPIVPLPTTPPGPSGGVHGNPLAASLKKKGKGKDPYCEVRSTLRNSVPQFEDASAPRTQRFLLNTGQACLVVQSNHKRVIVRCGLWRRDFSALRLRIGLMPSKLVEQYLPGVYRLFPETISTSKEVMPKNRRRSSGSRRTEWTPPDVQGRYVPTLSDNPENLALDITMEWSSKRLTRAATFGGLPHPYTLYTPCILYERKLGDKLSIRSESAVEKIKKKWK